VRALLAVKDLIASMISKAYKIRKAMFAILAIFESAFVDFHGMTGIGDF
jgi:hypothetical protein